MYVEELGWLTERESHWFLSEGDANLSDFNQYGHSYCEECADGKGDRFAWDRRFDDQGIYWIDHGPVQQGWRPQGREIAPRPMLDERDSPGARGYVPLEGEDEIWLSEAANRSESLLLSQHDPTTCQICIWGRARKEAA